jgi:hypothetical protein
MKEMVSTSDFPSLRVDPRGVVSAVDRLPNGYENEGEACTTYDGRQGRLVRAATGGLICQVEGTEDSLDGVKEAATALRFSSSSRTQIGKAYTDYVTNMRAVQGTGNLSYTPIQGAPGGWYFEVSSPTYNQYIDPARVRKIDGVTVTRVAPGGPIAQAQAILAKQ